MDGATEPTDETLMARFQQGDRVAYQGLVQRYAREILSYTTRLLRDRTWAEDLTQDVFLRLYQKAGTFRGESKVSTWLYRVARNACFDHLKRKRLEPRILPVLGGGEDREPGRLGLPDVSDVAPGPPRALEQAELRTRVHEALAAMPERFRAPFVLVVLQGRSYEEAGRLVGCSVKTLSSRLSRARERFRRALVSWVEPEGEPASAAARRDEEASS